MSGFAGASIGVVGKTNEKIGVIKMFEVKAYVTEIEPGSSYEVDIDGFKTTVASASANLFILIGRYIYNFMKIDDSVITFKSALTSVLEYKYGDCDFDFVCCGVKDGVACYVVSIYDYVW